MSTSRAEGIDWESLGAAATEAAQKAYAPYSRLQVGAAALTESGEVIVGCNVENASIGLTLCAECTLVGNQHLAGAGRLIALACRSGEGELLTPCGRCRQILMEAGGPGLLVDGTPMSELLPGAFTPEDLPE
ncbi:MAG TPA: cytidine deaminase [Acidimicrobiales bacterium]|jgi:cytidine deaminase|nr:cytidine deaminase [Acidimicrobiales bacterium]